MNSGRARGNTGRVRVIALFGPTGVGKTAVAIALAERLRAAGEDPVAVSADALQVYSGLELLTGAASAAERERLDHRLLSFLPVTETFSAGAFAELAHREVDDALEAGRRPLVVGGTGLYLQAALTDLDLRPPAPADVRERLEAELAERGSAALHADLAARDADAAAAIEPGDRTRVLRALELLEMGEEPAPRGAASRLWTAAMRHPTLLCGLTMEREALYARIDERVDAIVAAGGAEEVRRAEAAGASRTARAALGFEELLAGDVDAMKRRTRNLAKRQLTWLRRLEGAQLVDLTRLDPDTAQTAQATQAAQVTNVSSVSRPGRPASQRPSASELPRTTCPRPMARPPSSGTTRVRRSRCGPSTAPSRKMAALDATGMSRDRPRPRRMSWWCTALSPSRKQGRAAGAEGRIGGPRAGLGHEIGPGLAPGRVHDGGVGPAHVAQRPGRTRPPSGPPRSVGQHIAGRPLLAQGRAVLELVVGERLERGHQRGPLHQQVLLAGEPHAGTDATSASLASHRRRAASRLRACFEGVWRFCLT